jgi:CBS domain-containing protein
MLGRGNAISSLIVVGEGSWEQIELAGILTSTDFTRFFSENCAGQDGHSDPGICTRSLQP